MSGFASAAIDGLSATLEKFRNFAPAVDATAQILVDALKAGRKILTCGNGGSAADALHLSEELLGRYKVDRRPLPALCLAADPTLLTCIANDYGYESLFSRQVEGLAQPGDVFVVFSTSGNSPNQLAAVRTARAKGAITISLIGKDGGQLAGKSDHEIIVPSMETARVQEVHTLILHSWLERVDAEFATEFAGN